MKRVSVSGKRKAISGRDEQTGGRLPLVIKGTGRTATFVRESDCQHTSRPALVLIGAVLMALLTLLTFTVYRFYFPIVVSG